MYGMHGRSLLERMRRVLVYSPLAKSIVHPVNGPVAAVLIIGVRIPLYVLVFARRRGRLHRDELCSHCDRSGGENGRDAA